jgi:hypothetical protein
MCLSNVSPTCRAKRAEFDPLCQLAPAVNNGWGLLPFLPGLHALTANDLRQQSLAISEFNPSRNRKREMLLKVEEYILLAKLRAILRKEEDKPEEERDQQFIALAYETMAHLERQSRDEKSDSKSRP